MKKKYEKLSANNEVKALPRMQCNGHLQVIMVLVGESNLRNYVGI